VPATVLVSADSDGDGLPDAWELKVFGDLTTASATTDSDGDGLGDWAEYLTGTSPLDSRAGMTITPALMGSNGLTLNFPTVPGRTYRLQSSPDLTTWGDLTNYFATGTNLLVNLPVPPEARSFWRFKLQP